jgi:ribosomal protein L37E
MKAMTKKHKKHKKHKKQQEPVSSDQGKPDWTKQCDVCGSTPIVPETGMCAPCTFGEADTAGGNW